MDVDRAPSLEEQVAGLSNYAHVIYRKEFEDYSDEGNIEEVTDLSGANIISSQVIGMGGPMPFHTVAIDIDLRCALVPSSTPGHFHLYIDKMLPWDTYAALLTALADATIVEPGYVSAALERGYTSLRLPWIKKENA